MNPLVYYACLLVVTFFLSRKTYKWSTNHKVYNIYMYTALGAFILFFKFLGLVWVGIWVGAMIILGHTLGVLTKSWDKW